MVNSNMICQDSLVDLEQLQMVHQMYPELMWMKPKMTAQHGCPEKQQHICAWSLSCKSAAPLSNGAFDGVFQIVLNQLELG